MYFSYNSFWTPRSRKEKEQNLLNHQVKAEMPITSHFLVLSISFTLAKIFVASSKLSF